MPRCVYCDAPLDGRHGSQAAGGRRPAGRRQAYDPHLGRLWNVCPRCDRWTPVPLALRWEVLEEWEIRVRSEGRVLLTSEHLALIRAGDDEVVRVGAPTLVEWGAWRYGARLPSLRPAPGFLEAALRGLPPAPLEGYDPYGLTGPMGGVGGSYGPREWLASPFLDQARSLTLAFTSVPFARICPSCSSPMPINPWDFSNISLHVTSRGPGLEADCAMCRTRVSLDLGSARPALRLGLSVLDSDPAARALGEEAGAELERIGGGPALLRQLGGQRVLLGELDRTERIGLGIALDQEAEAEALELEWNEAEEIASIMDGELTDVPGFVEFRSRILGELG